MQLKTCQHSLKFITGHPCCKLSCLQCEHQCLRSGHMEEKMHQLFNMHDLIEKLEKKKNQLELLPVLSTQQIQRIYDQEVSKLLNKKKVSLEKIKSASIMQQNKRKQNEQYFAFLWKKFDLLKNKNLEKLTCSDIDQFMVQINEKNFANKIRGFMEEFKSGIVVIDNVTDQLTKEKKADQRKELKRQQQLRDIHYTQCREILTSSFKEQVDDLKCRFQDLRRQKQSLEHQLKTKIEQLTKISQEFKFYKQNYMEKNSGKKISQQNSEKKKKKKSEIQGQGKKSRIQQKKKFKAQDEEKKVSKQQNQETLKQGINKGPLLKNSSYFGSNLNELQKEIKKPEVFLYEPFTKQRVISSYKPIYSDSIISDKIMRIGEKVQFEKGGEQSIYSPPSFGQPLNQQFEDRNLNSQKAIEDEDFGFEDLSIPIKSIIEQQERIQSRTPMKKYPFS